MRVLDETGVLSLDKAVRERRWLKGLVEAMDPQERSVARRLRMVDHVCEGELANYLPSQMSCRNAHM